MKPIASLSLDLDNKWSYMKTHGDAGWDAISLLPGSAGSARGGAAEESMS